MVFHQPRKETFVLLLVLCILFLLMYFLEIRRAGYAIREQELLDSCQILTVGNQIYTLTRDLESGSTCFRISAENVTLDLNNHVLRGDGDLGDYGIVVERYDRAVIKNGIVQNFYIGILLNDSQDSRIQDNQIERNFDSGLVVFAGAKDVIQDNLFFANSYYGIKLVSGSDHQILRNTIYENFDSGLFLQSSSGNMISDNILNENSWNGISLYRSSRNVLKGNRVQRNFWNGVSLVASSQNIFSNHLLEKNARGIYLFASDENRFSEIHIAEGSAETSVYLANSRTNSFSDFTIENDAEGHYPVMVISTGTAQTSDNLFQDFLVKENQDIYSRAGHLSSNLKNIFRNVNYNQEIITSTDGKNEIQREWWLEIYAFQGDKPVDAIVEIHDNFGDILQNKTQDNGHLKIPLIEYVKTLQKKERYRYQVSVIYQGKSITKLLTMRGNRVEVFRF